MARIFEMNTPAASANTAGSSEPREQSKIWVNIGYEKNGKFVNLPFGTPIDTMKEAKVSGSNEDWIKLTNARNEFLRALQQLGRNLQPGQDMEIPHLIIKLHRVNEQVDIKPEDNEYSVDFSSLFSQAAE